MTLYTVHSVLLITDLLLANHGYASYRFRPGVAYVLLEHQVKVIRSEDRAWIDTINIAHTNIYAQTKFPQTRI